MASADYDGDQSRLGATIGVKNADPNANLVMGGLSGAYGSGNTWINSITKFLDAARTWSATNRAGSFPADVINVHYYSFGPGAPAPALSPEADDVESKLAAVVAYRDQNLPGKPVWWTEFGYDTYANSPLHAPALGSNSPFIVQGQWLVRELLAALAAGIERATLFELDDTCTPPATACSTQFATCGLLTSPDSSAPKPAWYFLATFRSRLQTMVYSGQPASGQSDVKIAQFNDTKSSGGAFVVWAPTSNATVHTGYALAPPAGATSAKAVALVDKQQNGTETALTPAGGSVTLDVTETPAIVLYGPYNPSAGGWQRRGASQAETRSRSSLGLVGRVFEQLDTARAAQRTGRRGRHRRGDPGRRTGERRSAYERRGLDLLRRRWDDSDVLTSPAPESIARRRRVHDARRGRAARPGVLLGRFGSNGARRRHRRRDVRPRERHVLRRLSDAAEHHPRSSHPGRLREQLAIVAAHRNAWPRHLRRDREPGDASTSLSFELTCSSPSPPAKMPLPVRLRRDPGASNSADATIRGRPGDFRGRFVRQAVILAG